MDRAAHLATLNGRLLQAFSRRSLETLRATSALRLVLPHVEPLLALNVSKEVRKDALAFHAAAAAAARATAPGAQDAERVLEATKAIDREFLRRLEDFPLRLEISYARVAPVRLRRIERLLDAAYRLLLHWPARTRLRAVIQAQYSAEAFEQLLLALLRLYAEEASALARAVRLPRLLAPLTERLVRRLDATLSEVAPRLAGDVVAGVYRRRDGRLAG
ncbi:MAG: hypothetical protein AMJ64_08100 [Betaproteobacteria bacterium SG8_39]|jgi:hypothetical protein|nr:MAG: hypothetical protein AMJ64_08100 [Betaproteobacteria bacterium SG8_39]